MANWDETGEGADLNDAWNYLRDILVDKVPEKIQSIQDSTDRLIKS